MKLTELKAAREAGTLVAYVSFGDPDSDYAQQVRIIDERGTRTVHTGRGYSSYRGHSAPGVVIEFADRPMRSLLDAPKRETVDQRKLVGTWEDYDALRTMRRERESKTRQHRSQSKAEAERVALNLKTRLDLAGFKAAYDAVEVVGIGGGHYGNRWHEPYAYAVRVATEILDRLMNGEFDA